MIFTNAPFDYIPATGQLALTGTWFDLPASRDRRCYHRRSS